MQYSSLLRLILACLVSPFTLVPWSRVRPLATTSVALLHLARSLASHLVVLMERPFMLFTLSSHIVLGLRRLPFPFISPSIIFSNSRSSLNTCPTHLDCATLDSSVHSGLIFCLCHPRFQCPFLLDILLVPPSIAVSFLA